MNVGSFGFGTKLIVQLERVLGPKQDLYREHYRLLIS